MASYILSNKKGGKAVILFDSGGDTITVDDLAVDSTETMKELSITGVYWSTATGSTITIERGGVVLLSLNESGSWPLYETNISINVNSTDDLVVTLPSDSSLVLEVRKVSEFESQYYGR